MLSPLTIAFAILDATLLLKIFALGRDMHWLWRRGRRFLIRAEACLHRRQAFDWDALRRKGQKPSRIAPTPPADRARYYLRDVVFRLPSLVLGTWVLLLLTPGPRSSATRPPSFLLTATALLLAVALIMGVADTLAQRLRYQWLDPYKPDWGLRATGPHPITMRSLTRGRMWARVYAYIVMHMYLNILGFGATYYMVVLVDPLSFHITMPSSSTALCMATVYFSAVTMATVGFGDIYPVSGIGYLLVCVQIAAGPLLLSMVLLGLGDSVPTRLSLDRSTGGLS